MNRLDRYTCEDAFRNLDDFLDRALGPDEERRVREHLEVCAACAAEFRFEEGFLTEVRSKLHRIESPPDLMDRIARVIAAERDHEG